MQLHAYHLINVKVNSVREANMKNRKHYFFDDMINIKNLDPNNRKIDERSCKSINIYYIFQVTPNSLNPLHYLIINNTNRYIEKGNRNKYSKLV